MGLLWGLTGLQALAVIVAAVVSYAVLVVLVRVSRARLVARFGAADGVLLLVLGAVIGRGILGITPTLGAAALGCGALVVVRIGLAVLSRGVRGRRLVEPPPLILVGGGRIVVQHGAVAHIRDDELLTALRRSGVARIEDVACAVLESDGGISVIRVDESKLLDRRLLLGVQGVEHIPDRFFADT